MRNGDIIRNTESYIKVYILVHYENEETINKDLLLIKNIFFINLLFSFVVHLLIVHF
jgi:hypothetical protein